MAHAAQVIVSTLSNRKEPSVGSRTALDLRISNKHQLKATTEKAIEGQQEEEENGQTEDCVQN
jgi:hypothetical protein